MSLRGPRSNLPGSPHSVHIARRLGVLAALATAALLGGCQKSLFSPDEMRSPYDRYDAIRAQRPPAYIEDEFGWKKPNVRGRLLDND